VTGCWLDDHILTVMLEEKSIEIHIYCSHFSNIARNQ
jgi:hypothetical protein